MIIIDHHLYTNNHIQKIDDHEQLVSVIVNFISMTECQNYKKSELVLQLKTVTVEKEMLYFR